MTPAEKANQLVQIYHKEMGNLWVFQAKKCALIAVDEIITALYSFGNETLNLQNMDSDFRYWEEVKQEIEKL